ncbi:MAG: hypothetical protein ACQEXJ_10710 [Myxococcota bacterium]
MSDDAPMEPEELDTLVDELTSGVPGERHHQVLAWTLWGIPPWSSFLTTLSRLHASLRERHAEALAADPAHEALTSLTMARVLLVERTWPAALEVLEGAEAPARESGKATLVRLGRALAVRARLSVGEITAAFEAVRGGALEGLRRDPPEFAAEGHVALGLTAIVAGQHDIAESHLDDAAEAAKDHDREELGAWQAARVEVGRAHVSFRDGRPDHALEHVDAACARAREQDGLGELAEWRLLRAAYALAAGRAADADEVREAVTLAERMEGRHGAMDLLAGLPADVAGVSGPEDLSGRLRAALQHRSEARDAHGWLLAALAGCAVLAAHDRPGEARDLAEELQRLFSGKRETGVGRMALQAASVLTRGSD